MAQIVYYVSANFSSYEDSWETFLGLFDTLEEAEKVKSEYEKVVENIKSEENPAPDFQKVIERQYPEEIIEQWRKYNRNQMKVEDLYEVEIRVLTINEKQSFGL